LIRNDFSVYLIENSLGASLAHQALELVFALVWKTSFDVIARITPTTFVEFVPYNVLVGLTHWKFHFNGL
jgi:hypothetical protein